MQWGTVHFNSDSVWGGTQDCISNKHADNADALVPDTHFSQGLDSSALDPAQTRGRAMWLRATWESLLEEVRGI